MDEATLKIIEVNPIGDRLDAFRKGFASICDSMGLVCSADAFDLLGQNRQSTALYIMTALQSLPAAKFLRSASGNKLIQDIIRLNYTLSFNPDDFDLSRIKPLLKAVLDNSDDVAVWTQAYKALSDILPPLPLTPPSAASNLITDARAATATAVPPVSDTPWSRSTASITNSSEIRHEVDPILRAELGSPRVGIRRFRESFFARVPGLETAATAVFDKCREGDNPIFGQDGWNGWPVEAKEADVLAWFRNTISKLEEFATDYRPANLTHRRKLLTQPNTALIGSAGRRRLDIGFVNDNFMVQPKLGRYRWSHILVPGELKSNPTADALPLAWIDLATYAKEVFSSQDTRRFVLAFTLCGSYLRLWEYDRLGGMASEQFNINEPRGGLEFVASMLGFLWLDAEGMGFDPTIIESEGKRFIEIERNGKPERLIIDAIVAYPRGIASRATTCWKAHREDDPLKKRLVIKDSWQYPERDEEGLFLREATEKGVVNVARYYHHETVHIGGVEDEIRNSIRKGLDTVAATAVTANAITGTNDIADTAATVAIAAISDTANTTTATTNIDNDIDNNGDKSFNNNGVAATKRRRSEANLDGNDGDGDSAASERPAKRFRSESANSGDAVTFRNRVHRRVVLQDYARPIYTASSPTALVKALENCIRGHESLRQQTGFLHRDISVNNVMIDEDGPDDRKGLLIDLDLAIKEQRIKASEAKEKTGTTAFMAINVLNGMQHSFMHDLESFFWVLFWICVHYDGPNEGRISEFDSWNYLRDYHLAGAKLSMIYDTELFCRRIESSFTPFYAPLIPLMKKLRAVVFPDGKPWREANEKLYSMMREVLLQGLE